ncbi:MAG: hypothetical protein OXH11_18070, partial [Candidatus Aminicenantes bacterium]|nr:hypothetical protein [Candidatus Aminicenantes bacterium]
ILDLKPGANVKEIVEARDDLLVLWDPNRLKSHPRLRSKAAVKIREIHGAYQVLMQHPGQEEARAGADASAARGPSPVSEAGPGPSADAPLSPASGTASLFDEVFRDRKTEKRLRLPMAPILAGAVVVLSAVLVLLLIGGGEAPTETPPTAVTDPAPEPPVSPEPAGAPVDTASGQTADSSSTTAVDPDPAKTVDSGAGDTPPASPPRQEIKPPPKPRVATAPEPAPLPPAKPEKPKPLRPPRPGDRPVLVREPDGGTPPTAGETPTPERKSADEEAEKRQLEEAEKAYRDLLSGSKAAQRLVDGQVPGTRFAEWSIAGRRGSELLVDLVAEQFGGQPVHFVWGVDTATGKVKALSQAARQLEQVAAQE